MYIFINFITRNLYFQLSTQKILLKDFPVHPDDYWESVLHLPWVFLQVLSHFPFVVLCQITIPWHIFPVFLFLPPKRFPFPFPTLAHNDFQASLSGLF